tara:strand:- start:89 stop:232 length:144 start_codon:yes stop_codon:yes gene_type:complete
MNIGPFIKTALLEAEIILWWMNFNDKGTAYIIIYTIRRIIWKRILGL